MFAVLASPLLRWRIVGGRLPAGLRLKRTGRIIGIPRRLGSSTFTIELKGALKSSPSLRRRLTLAVRRTPTVTAITRGRGRGSGRGRGHGGTRVTLAGTGFATARSQTIVRFGRLIAPRVRSRSHTTCTAGAPLTARAGSPSPSPA